ncbi:SGNH/GDSL hydrolase family protein, partial [Streptomyces sp. OF3]
GEPGTGEPTPAESPSGTPTSGTPASGAPEAGTTTPGTSKAGTSADGTPGGGAPSGQPLARTADGGGRVLYLGDSIATENQDEVGRRVRKSGHDYRAAPHSGTTLCDYLEGTGASSLVPAAHKAAALVRDWRPDTVVLQFWGNSWLYTPCMEGVAADHPDYLARYGNDIRAITRQIENAAAQAGIPQPRLVWVVQGPDAFNPDRIPKINQLYEMHVVRAGGLLADAGARVSAPGARYTHTNYLPCNAEETAAGLCRDGRAQLHRDDDPLHFCLAPLTANGRPCPAPSPGVWRYAAAIADTVG